MNSKQSLTKITTAADFAERLRKVGTDLIDLSRELVAILDSNPAFTDELVAEGFDRRFINRLERFGRGHIHPSLLYTTSPGGIRLIGLPLSEQSKLIEEGVEVLEEDATTRLIPIHDLTTSQASRVFSRGRLRSLAEQRTVLQKKRFAKAPTVPDESWVVYKTHVVTSRPGKWPKALLLQWLAEMG